MCIRDRRSEERDTFVVAERKFLSVTGDFFNGTDTSWIEYSASLAVWADSDVELRFVLSTDGSVVGDGWWVDDISITDVAVAGECTSVPHPVFADGFESGDTSAWDVVIP